MQKVSLVVVRADDLLELPVFKDVKAAAAKRGESYPKVLQTNSSLRVSRDYGMHSLEHRWADDPNAAPRDKDKQVEVFKDDDGVELMLPYHMKDFLAGLVEQLIAAKIDIHRELSSAVVHCTKCPIEPTHPVVAEPIGDDYIPTWMRALTKDERSKLMNMKASGRIGVKSPRPRNWTIVQRPPNPTATRECLNSASMVNQQPNPWNARKIHGAQLPGAEGRPSSSMPSGSSTDGVQAEQSNPVASVRAQTTQAEVTEIRSKASIANWKRRQQKKAKKEAGEK